MNNHNEAWGKSDQKMILVSNGNYTELYNHLKDGCWQIEFISACTGYDDIYMNTLPSCYVVLNKN
jgi:hypothetical protein